MNSGKCGSVTYTLPHDGDRGEWAGGTTGTVGGGGWGRRVSDAGRLLRTAMDLSWKFRARALIGCGRSALARKPIGCGVSWDQITKGVPEITVLEQRILK